MAKSISTIQTELCDSEIGKLRNPISLYQVIGELYSTADVNPPPITLLTDLQGYWNGGSATADYGTMADWNDPGGDVLWAWGSGPNGGGASLYQAFNGLGVENTDAIVQAMISGPTTVMVWGWDAAGTFSFCDVVNKAVPGGAGYIITPQFDFELYHTTQNGSCTQANDYYGAIPFNPTWQQFVMTNTATDKKVYMNGALLGTNSSPGLCASNNEPLRIEGRYWEMPLAFALMAFWTRELDATEIAQLYNGGLGLLASEL